MTSVKTTSKWIYPQVDYLTHTAMATSKIHNSFKHDLVTLCTVVLVRAEEWPEESNDYTSMKDAKGQT